MAVKSKAAEEAVETAPKFTIDQMLPHCRKLFDVSAFVFIGATEGMTGEYTVEETRKTIKEWLEKEVK